MIDIVFIVLVIMAISITAVVLAKVLSDTFSLNLLPNKSGDASLVITDPDINNRAKIDDGAPSRPTLPGLQEGDADTSADPTETKLESVETGQYVASVTDSGGQFVETVYGSSPIILPITWGAVIGAVIWRGKVRSQWNRHGYDYDTFRLVAKMRGSPMRQRLLDSLRDVQKNKLQLAKELDVDWKTIDNHIDMLLEARLVEEKNRIGTAKYYSLTKNGEKVLSLLAAREDQESKYTQ
jgi:DNA-binding transcriptional ArsR family regulator